MKKYIYKVVFKYVKNPEELLKKGFSLYEDEEKTSSIYAINLTLDKDSLPVKHIVKFFEKLYKEKDNNEEIEKDFADSGVRITKKGKVALNSACYKDICKAQLCFTANGNLRNTLFINAADNTQFYDSELLDNLVGNIITNLEREGYIYKKVLHKK